MPESLPPLSDDDMAEVKRIVEIQTAAMERYLLHPPILSLDHINTDFSDAQADQDERDGWSSDDCDYEG